MKKNLTLLTVNHDIKKLISDDVNVSLEFYSTPLMKKPLFDKLIDLVREVKEKCVFILSRICFYFHDFRPDKRPDLVFIGSGAWYKSDMRSLHEDYIPDMIELNRVYALKDN